MKRFSAQYVITNTGPVLKRAVVTVDDDGTIIDVRDTGGVLEEGHSTEFFNGIIIPGFVNCHCHLELSHMKGLVPKNNGLASFIEEIRSTRISSGEQILKSAVTADKDMYDGGISLCADICNTSETFGIKKQSRISYLNLIEVFGIDPAKAEKRMNEISALAGLASEMGLPCSIVPHSVYSVSLPLFRLIRKKCADNKVSSIHFMENPAEKELVEDHTGAIVSSYERSGILPPLLETARDHSSAILNEITLSGNLILVHNTFINSDIIKNIRRRRNLYFCLCPNSNVYIEHKLPPVDLLISEGCEIVIGTDSLASNDSLDILKELITLQLSFPELSAADLIRWATYNGAKALAGDNTFGSIGPGKKPGLLLLMDTDLQNLKLLPGSYIKRLV